MRRSSRDLMIVLVALFVSAMAANGWFGSEAPGAKQESLALASGYTMGDVRLGEATAARVQGSSDLVISANGSGPVREVHGIAGGPLKLDGQELLPADASLDECYRVLGASNEVHEGHCFRWYLSERDWLTFYLPQDGKAQYLALERPYPHYDGLSESVCAY